MARNGSGFFTMFIASVAAINGGLSYYNSHLYKTTKEEFETYKKEILMESKPVVEKVVENRIDVEGHATQSERNDTVAYVVPTYILKQ